MPFISSKELCEKRAAVIEKMKDLLATCDKEERMWSADEKETYAALEKEAAELAEQIESVKQFETARSADRGDIEPFEQPERRESHREEQRQSPEQQLEAFRSWCLGGRLEGDLTERYVTGRGSNELILRGDSYARAVRAIEQRAQTAGGTTAGGFTVPDELMREIEVSLLAFGGMFGASTRIRTATGADLPIPTVNDTAQVGEIIAENTTANDQDMTFGQLVLQSYKYSSKIVKCSIEFLQDTSVNPTQLIGRLLGERLGRIANQHFTTGTGSGQPNGIVTAAGNSGVTTASNTVLDYIEVLTLEHSVDPAYRAGASFMGNDTTLRILKSMEDSQGRPIYLPSLVSGLGNGVPMIDGYPYIVNQDMASGTSAKALLFGDLSKYLIREVMETGLIRLNERYAELGQVAFLAWTRWDGDLLDSGTDPVKYLTLAV